jgi:Sulfotransferase family
MADQRTPLVLLLGSPRSGTTWLQTMLGSHDAIATPQETDLFRMYYEPLVQAWRQQIEGATDASSERRRKGLPLVVSELEFVASIRPLLDAVLDSIARMKPTARVVIEKSPSHSIVVDTIHFVDPEARFVHIVRDGRDAAASMVAAHSDGWGARWAPDSIANAAGRWQRHVIGARKASALGRDRYLEVRYEDFVGPDGAAALQSVFAFVGVDVGDDEARSILDEHHIDRARNSVEVSSSLLIGGELGDDPLVHSEPPGFIRRGGSGGWRSTWSVRDRQAFAESAGDLLVQLGYEPDAGWIGAPPRPAVAVRAVRRLSNETALGLRRLADRLDGSPPRRPRRRKPGSDEFGAAGVGADSNDPTT